MAGFFLRLFVTFCLLPLSFITASMADIALSGRLVKKYYKSPSAIPIPAFGWFVILDNSSKEAMDRALSELDMDERLACADFDKDLIQLMLEDEIHLQTCGDLEGYSICVCGQLWNPPHLYRPILAHQLTLRELKAINLDKDAIISENKFFPEIKKSVAFKEKTGFVEINDKKQNAVPLELSEDASPLLVSLQGYLQLNLYPGPPNYESVERGDYPQYCWILSMDSESFDVASQTPVLEPALSIVDIMSVPNYSEVQLGLESDTRKFCENHINQKVNVEGYISHAILGHHHAPFLMSVQSAYAVPEE